MTVADRVLDTLVDAFLDDPLYRWLYPDPTRRPAALRANMEHILGLAAERGLVEHTADGDAVAVWTEPGAELLDDPAPFMDLLTRWAPERVDHAVAGMGAVGAHRPAEPLRIHHPRRSRRPRRRTVHVPDAAQAMITLAHKPTLDGAQVRLRPFRDGDLDALWKMVNEPEGNRLTGTHTTFTRDQIEHWYRTRADHDDRLDLAIATRADDACVGEAVLADLHPANAACSFRISLIGPEVYGRGYGTEATRLILAHAFETVGLHRVGLEVYAFNHRALRTYRNVGFTVEGVRRDALLWDGTFHDAILMSMLAADWHRLSARPPDEARLPVAEIVK